MCINKEIIGGWLLVHLMIMHSEIVCINIEVMSRWILGSFIKPGEIVCINKVADYTLNIAC